MSETNASVALMIRYSTLFSSHATMLAIWGTMKPTKSQQLSWKAVANV